MQFRTGRPEQLRQAEWGVCLGATLAAIGLHVVYLTHAGGLWRDEAHSIRVAASATVAFLVFAICTVGCFVCFRCRRARPSL